MLREALIISLKKKSSKTGVLPINMEKQSQNNRRWNTPPRYTRIGVFSPRETRTHLHTPQYKTQLAEEGWEKDNKHHLFLKEMGLKEKRNFFGG